MVTKFIQTLFVQKQNWYMIISVFFVTIFIHSSKIIEDCTSPPVNRWDWTASKRGGMRTCEDEQQAKEVVSEQGRLNNEYKRWTANLWGIRMNSKQKRWTANRFEWTAGEEVDSKHVRLNSEQKRWTANRWEWANDAGQRAEEDGRESETLCGEVQWFEQVRQEGGWSVRR